MLGRLILDEHRARTDHPELALHLGDAVGDLRTVIARLESELAVTVFSDRQPHRGKAESSAVAQSEQPDTQPPMRRALTVHQMEQRV